MIETIKIKLTGQEWTKFLDVVGREIQVTEIYEDVKKDNAFYFQYQDRLWWGSTNPSESYAIEILEGPFKSSRSVEASSAGGRGEMSPGPFIGQLDRQVLSITDRVMLVKARLDILLMKATNSGYDWSHVPPNLQSQLEMEVLNIDRILGNDQTLTAYELRVTQRETYRGEKDQVMRTHEFDTLFYCLARDFDEAKKKATLDFEERMARFKYSSEWDVSKIEVMKEVKP